MTSPQSLPREPLPSAAPPWGRHALALLLALLLPVGAWAKAPTPPKPPTDEAERYRQLEAFARVLAYVENNYVEPVDREALMHGAIRGMLETLDPHTVYMPPDVFKEMKIDTAGEFGGLGLELARKDDRIVVVAPLDDTPAARAGIRAGDELVALDGRALRGLELTEVLRLMRGPAGKKVRLTIMREGFTAPRPLVVVRDHIRIHSVEGALYGEIAHVRIKSFQDRTDVQLQQELEQLRRKNGGKPLRGLVLDLRNNPGGLLDQAVAVADRFLAAELTIVSTRGRSGGQSSVDRSRGPGTEPDYPMVVLVNAGTASASEIVAGALQDHQRATLLGTRSFGKGSVQTVIELEDGSGLKLTIARYYTPSGRSIQELGIRPDYQVEDAAGVKTGAVRERDLQRHFANEAGQAQAEAPPPPPPSEASRDWSATRKLEDLPLKAALNLLHHGAARAAGGAR